MGLTVVKCLDHKCSDVEDQTCVVHLICVCVLDRMDAGQDVADLMEDPAVQIAVDPLLVLLDVVEVPQFAIL